MRPLYEERGLATVLYAIAIVAWLGSEALIATRVAVSRARSGPGVAGGDRRQDRLSGPALIFGVFLAISLARLASDESRFAISFARPEWFGLAFALALAGIALRLYSVWTLGSFFDLRVRTTAGQSVVNKGPYRLVRHPSYTGALLTVLGVLLMWTNWLSLACFVFALPGFAYRIKVEEEALAGSLGEPYREYMRSTKRLIPYVL